MREKEVRWISRDKNNCGYEIWRKKPRPLNNHGIFPGCPMFTLCDSGAEEIGIKLAQGGLAKVTIERQY